jgi:transposase
MDRHIITAPRRQALERQLRSAADARVYRRTLAVLEVARGRPVADAARALGVTRQAVHTWLATYARDLDPLDLADAPRTGRPPLWTPALGDMLRAALARPPDRFGYRATNWTVPLLREHVAGRAGVRPSGTALRRWLRALGYAWKRYRYVLPPDPDREKKTRPPAAGAGPAGADRPAGRRRDRPAAVPAAAGRLGPAGRAGAGADQRGQR